MKKKKTNVSFEFFPPKNEEAINSLWLNIRRLEPLKPRFISVTYGAGGSTRENTHDLVKQIKKNTNLEPAAHLTCIESTKSEIEKIAADYWDVRLGNSCFKRIVLKLKIKVIMVILDLPQI